MPLLASLAAPAAPTRGPPPSVETLRRQRTLQRDRGAPQRPEAAEASAARDVRAQNGCTLVWRASDAVAGLFEFFEGGRKRPY